MHQKRDFVKKFAEFADNYIFLKSGDEKISQSKEV